MVWAVGAMWSVGTRREDRVLVEDVVQLPFEPPELVVREPEAGEMRDVFDIGAREGGHAPDDSRDMPTPRLRPMTPADIEPAAAAILADDWGDRRSWFEFAVASTHCRTFVAEAGRRARSWARVSRR